MKQMTELQRQKLSSRRFWVVCWAIFILSFWGSVSLFRTVTHPWMALVMPILSGIPVGYVTIESLKKKPKVGE